jgi:RHH-type rel operon transcriptional repressor/antitoxin RelB
MLSVRLPEELENRLNNLAKATRRPKSYYVREALERSIEDLEDAYLAESAYEEFLKSGEQSVPLEELEQSLGLDD